MWADRIELAANAGGFDSDNKTRNDVYYANCWHSCVCKEAGAKMSDFNGHPDEGGPADPKLRDMGREFYRAVQSNNVEKAANLYGDIYQRVDELQAVLPEATQLEPPQLNLPLLGA